MKKGLICLLFPLAIIGCATTKNITNTNNDGNKPKIDTVYVEKTFNPLDTLKGEQAYIKSKEFLENAQHFYEEGKDDSSKVYFEKGTKILSQANLSADDHDFIGLRESLDNLEQYKRQKEAIENGIALSKEEIETAEEKFPMEKRFAERVAHYEKLLETKQNEWFLKSLEKFLQYEPYLDSVTKEKDIPELIKFMYPIESGMNHLAKSRARAKGIPQFMEKTGKRYGLKIFGLWYDERLDPLKAIPASLDYIDSLLNDFQDPNLAIAAYNCGEGRIINKLMRFNSYNYNELFEKQVLPRETLDHIPKIYAYKDLRERTIIENPKKDIILENLLTNNFDVVEVKRQTGFKEMAKILGITKEELKQYNPAYGFDATPPEKMIRGKYFFEVRIPKGAKEKFVEEMAKITEPCKFEGGAYTIKRGDNLSEIARRFGVELYDLKKANGFPDPKKLKIGSKLIIPEK